MVTGNCCPWLIAQPVVCPCACALPSVGTGEKPTEPQLLPLAFTSVNTQSVSPLLWSDVMLVRVSVNGKLLQLPLTQEIATGRLWFFGEIFVEAVDVGGIAVGTVAELVTVVPG